MHLTAAELSQILNIYWKVQLFAVTMVIMTLKLWYIKVII